MSGHTIQVTDEFLRYADPAFLEKREGEIVVDGRTFRYVARVRDAFGRDGGASIFREVGVEPAPLQFPVLCDTTETS